MQSKIPQITLPTIASIISWANDTALMHDVQFLAGNRSMPYIFKAPCFYYFKEQERRYVLIMVSERDLESFS